MALEAIAAINDPTFKTGVGKNGKPWTMMQVTTDKNNVTTVFAPAAIGDKLELTWNDQYGNFSAKKVTAQDLANLEAMRKLYELNLAIYKAVTGTDYGAQVATTPVEPVVPKPVAKQPDVVHEVPEEEISLDQIPF